ncbi:MAG: hypothetical protein ACI4J4_05340 [Ruminiclostridium sp.]
MSEKTFLLYNYSPSMVIVQCKDSTITFEGGTAEAPTSFPFTMNELQYINNKCEVIKNGILVPAEDEAEYVYGALRIQNYQNILSNQQIEDIILHPTVEGLEKILAIKDTPYYERIYGIFISLRNADAPITANVARIIKGRYLELRDGKRDTEFTVRQKDTQRVDSEDVEALKQRLAAVEKLLAEKAKEEPVETSCDDGEKPKEIRRTSKGKTTKTTTSGRTTNK